jgi:Fe-S-cluster containining protein
MSPGPDPETIPPSAPEPESGEAVAGSDLLRGLVYAHNRANANTGEVHRAAATVEAIVDLLVERGLVDRAALESRRREASERLRREYIDRGMAVASQDFRVSKYEFEGGARIDCENRIQFCKAACCKLPVALSTEDVREGVIRWDPGQPYVLAHAQDGYCVHMDRGTLRCKVYEQRPIPCRGYDCRQDRRIWLNFERKIPNPRLDDADWPYCLEANEADGPEAQGDPA